MVPTCQRWAETTPPPDELAASIVEVLQAALEQFAAIAEDMSGKGGVVED